MPHPAGFQGINRPMPCACPGSGRGFEAMSRELLARCWANVGASSRCDSAPSQTNDLGLCAYCFEALRG